VAGRVDMCGWREGEKEVQGMSPEKPHCCMAAPLFTQPPSLPAFPPLDFTWMEVNILRSLFKRRGSGGKTGTGTKPAMRQARKAIVKSREGRKTRITQSPFRTGVGKRGAVWARGEGGGRSPLAILRARACVSPYVNESTSFPLSSTKVKARLDGCTWHQCLRRASNVRGRGGGGWEGGGAEGGAGMTFNEGLAVVGMVAVCLSLSAVRVYMCIEDL